MQLIETKVSQFAFILLVLGLGCRTVQANDVYIAQNQVGVGDGSSCASAYPMTFFNSSSNWSGAIGPGTTVHLCGTFNAPAGASGFLTFRGSGSSGNPITLTAEPGVVLQAPYWGLGGAIAAPNVSWVTLDGKNNGIVQATANGTNLANHAPDCGGTYCMSGISLTRCDNCVVQNWTVANIYVNVPPNDENPVTDTAVGIFYNSGNNVVISGNTVHDAKWCVTFGYWPQETTQNVKIFSNTLYNCDHGVSVFSDNSGAILNNLYIYGNTIHDGVNWDDTLDHNHHDGIHLSPTQTNTQLNNAYVYNNYIYGDWGFHCNSFIYLAAEPDPAISETITNANVYNNLLVNTSAANTCANGLIQDFGGRNSVIANNTLIGSGAAAGTGIILEEASPYHTIVKNNILSGFQNGYYVGQGFAMPVSDYNDLYNVANITFVWGTDCCTTLQNWRAQAGGPDAHSTTNNPRLNALYVPQSSSPVIQKGTNLSSLGLPGLNADKAGMARPSGSWDMGAYQAVTVAGSRPNPPTSLNVQVH